MFRVSTRKKLVKYMSQKLLLKTLKWNEKCYMPFFNAKKKKYKNFELFGYIPNKLSYKAVKMKSGNRQLCSLYCDTVFSCEQSTRAQPITCSLGSSPRRIYKAPDEEIHAHANQPAKDSYPAGVVRVRLFG